MLAVAIVGVVINLAATASLAKANRSSLNVEGAYKHIITDLYGFIGTIVAAIIILTTGWTRADPVASLVVVALMLHAAYGLLRDSGHILLEAAPGHLDLDDILAHLLATEHVIDVHDLHVWTVTSDLPALRPTSCSTTAASSTATPRSCSTSCRRASSATSTSSTRRSSSSPRSHGRHEIGAH